MNEQRILTASDNYIEVDEYIIANNINSIFLVCDDSLDFLKVGDYFKNLEARLGTKVVFFKDFVPNPLYESVVAGVDIFLTEKCDVIFAVGGGSAMDVAKCIKLYSNMNHSRNYLEQEIVPNDIKFVAIPTTAGTGSEATRYAVIYFNGEKQSVADYSAIPTTVIMDSSVLNTLPMYQKKATLMDALCHAIESFWSVNSTEESRELSKEAIGLIYEYKDKYLAGDNTVNNIMLKASNTAGKAINITQTTAGHAMCYKLTSLYGIAHGHAAALCLPDLWKYMLDNMDKCIDKRGQEYLSKVFDEIAEAMGYSKPGEAAQAFKKMVADIGLLAPMMENKGDYEKLRTSVNPVRLKNNPVSLSEEAIDDIYHHIFQG